MPGVRLQPEQGFERALRTARRATRRATRLAAAALVLTLLAGAALGVAIVGRDRDHSSGVQATVAAARAGTVRVLTDRDGRSTGAGSGWVLDAGRRLVVTAGHVVNEGSSFRVAGARGSAAADVLAAA